MKKKITACLLVALMSLNISSVGFASNTSVSKTYDSSTRNVSQNKVWTIVFSENVKDDSLEDYVKVEDDRGRDQDIDVEIGANSKEIYVIPDGDYDEDEEYVLTVEKEILSDSNKHLKSDYKFEFETDDDEKLDLWMSRDGKTYDDDDADDGKVSGNAYVKADDIRLRDIDIDGRLYIDAGSDGEVSLDNVKASRLVIISAKDNGIDMDDCDFDRIDGDKDKIKDYDETDGDDVILGRIDSIDVERKEITLEIESQESDGDEDEYTVVVDKDSSFYDDIKDDVFEEDDIVKIYSDKSGSDYDLKSMEMLIEDRNYDKYPVYCVVDNDEDEIELGFGEDKDTDYDDYSNSNIAKMDKAKHSAEIVFSRDEIDEGDFVQVHVDDNGRVDALGLAFINTKFDEDYYAEKSPSGDIADDAIMKFKRSYDKNSKTYVELESENGKEYTAEAKKDAEDMIDDNELNAGDIVKIEYDEDDEEVTDFDLLIKHDAGVYKVLDVDSDSIELGYDKKPSTREDDFASSDRENFDKDSKCFEFGSISENDFVQVSLNEDDEVEALAVVDTPDELAKSKPRSGSSSDSDKLIVYVKDIDKSGSDYEIEVEDEDGDEYTLEAVGDAEDLLERDKLDEKSVIEMDWDKGDKEISDFKVLIKAFDDEDDDVYKVIQMNKTSMELGFDDKPSTDIDDFRSSDKEDVDMDRSAEMFRDPDEGDFVKVYMDDDEIKAVLRVSRPDELADEAPED